ncbi:MAG TPA: PEP-CTERM sorting domain-containing protein [Burkholderiaceae bacterium]
MKKMAWISVPLLALVCTAAQAQFIQFSDSPIKGITGLSYDGSRAVGAGLPGESQFYKWTADGGAVNLGATYYGGQASISADGNTILYNALNPATGYYEMTRAAWAGGPLTPMGSLGGVGASTGQAETSSSYQLSGDGQTGVGLAWLSISSGHAMVSHNGVVTDLGSSVPNRSTRANAVSYDGGVVGGWQDASWGFRQGAVWKNGQQYLMTTSEGYELGEVRAMSSDGNWAFGNGYDFGAYRWSQATGTQLLGSLWEGAYTAAFGASADGQVAVGASWGWDGPPTWGRAFIWTAGGGMLDLTDYATGLGYDLGGAVLAGASTISGDGSTIAGFTSTGDAFLLHLNTSPVPEPGTMLLMSLGVCALLAGRKRSEA